MVLHFYSMYISKLVTENVKILRPICPPIETLLIKGIDLPNLRENSVNEWSGIVVI